MNKAKRARCCNPLEGVGTQEGDYDSGYYDFWGEGGGLARAAPLVVIYSIDFIITIHI